MYAIEKSDSSAFSSVSLNINIQYFTANSSLGLDNVGIKY